MHASNTNLSVCPQHPREIVILARENVKVERICRSETVCKLRFPCYALRWRVPPACTNGICECNCFALVGRALALCKVRVSKSAPAKSPAKLLLDPRHPGANHPLKQSVRLNG